MTKCDNFPHRANWEAELTAARAYAPKPLTLSEAQRPSTGLRMSGHKSPDYAELVEAQAQDERI